MPGGLACRRRADGQYDARLKCGRRLLQPCQGMWEEALGLANLASAGFALAAVAYLAFAVYLMRSGLWRRPVERAALPFLAGVLATVGWGVLGLVDLGSSKVWTWHAALALDQLRYVAWAVFMLLLLQQPDPAAGRWRLLWRGRAPLACVLVLALVGLGLNVRASLSPQVPAAADLRALAASQLAWAVFGLVLLEQVFRNQAEASRWSAKPLCLGLGGVFVYDIYLFAQAVMFGDFDGDALSARGLVHALAVPLLLVASRRQAHWLARVQVSKTAAFYSASLLLIGIYLLVIAAAGYYVKFFGGSWGGTLQVALLAAALLGLTVLVFSGALRARVRVFLNKHFFRYSYDYRLEWLSFTAMLSSKSTPQEVGGLVVRGLADMVECPAGALWFKALGDDRYVQSAAWNLPQRDTAEPVDSPLCRFMREREWIVDVASAQAAAAPEPEAGIVPPWLQQLDKAWIVVPLLVADEMLGFVVLAQPRTPIELDWEVRDLLKTAARQAASFLALIHATEALLETRKFDAFNRMSAFVVHDLKNIITQLGLMLKNAERHSDNPEFQKDMFETVGNSVEKMRQILLQLREGPRPAGVPSRVDLSPIVLKIQRAAAMNGRLVNVEIVHAVAARGHEQRLERVIGHIVQNALEASAPAGTVAVHLRQHDGLAQVVVDDTGTGMTEDFIRTRLFRPFNSTKASGMGIGTYESALYVKELGGRIAVRSQIGQGSTLTIELPMFEKAADGGSDR